MRSRERLESVDKVLGILSEREVKLVCQGLEIC